jgi:orotidine-5'-phosphate decarboxylase
MNKDVIVALDFNNVDELDCLLSQFDESIYVKIGMELFYDQGPFIIDKIKACNHKVFLDLKLHDIPNTVKAACRVISKYDVDLVNVHAQGGIEMMKAARDGLAGHIKLIAVTHLTSSTQSLLTEVGVNDDLSKVVMQLATNACSAGLDGVVCSVLESRLIKDKLGDSFITVCPGVRRDCDAINDQKRVVTPFDAHVSGCDYIVVGRPITLDVDPVGVYNEIKNEFIKGEK